MSKGMTAIKEKRLKLYRSRFIERSEMERLNDIVNPVQQYIVKKIVEAKDIELKQIEQQQQITGYCLCGYALTRKGKCMMYPNHTEVIA